MTLFSPKTQQFLSEYGWFPERYVDLSDTITKLSKEGFDIFEAALVLLQNVHGIDARTPKGTPINFSAADGLGTYDDLAPWMRAHRMRLYPLGGWSQDTLYLDEYNRLYRIEFTQIARVGETITDGLDALIFDHSSEAFVVIPPRLF